MKTVAELLEDARREIADSVDHGARDGVDGCICAIQSLCDAIEQMQPHMVGTLEQPYGLPLDSEAAIRKDERERIARLFEKDGAHHHRYEPRLAEKIAMRIRESAP